MFAEIKVITAQRTEFVEITEPVKDIVEKSKVKDGVCFIYVPHTTAGVFINENADEDVATDIKNTLEKLIPWINGYKHIEGNAAAHIKSVLTGNNVAIPIKDGKLTLGRWQGIFFAEFDGGRTRKVYIKILEGV
ncbi:secondary thiamine-phosphate synthase enzyme YjbQ [Venenivibrio stagnispumantis]|uniref:Secondary thiamine-phosphate synthase enzyme n=1 Tax=Venenivibrio stagnispumantis TaxID=407998 RepID=A0AA45WKA4_9AQUI|nr:secondary thiamine-phosphate synthase enzyme YjbQ [Venenivibrio stagnispumantis]MCW4573496.1 secondary thiamine-phosphate synthase enzyme YjbQ [Venenivibrio stagnispumantis]SMP06610.1 secondary thiamine-phosphate synthase enzyme [Venenivibrio stagnispumantis]